MPMMNNVVRIRTGRGTLFSKVLHECAVGPFPSAESAEHFRRQLSEELRKHPHIVYFLYQSRGDAWVDPSVRIVAPDEFSFEVHAYVPPRRNRSLR